MFRNLEHTDRHKVNLKAVDTLAEAVLNGYDKSFLRVADYLETRKLYFYPFENQLIPFQYADKYEIFTSALSNEESNVMSVDRAKSILIEDVEKIIKQQGSNLQSYNESKSAFIKERNALLNGSIRIKYSTKLKYEKKKMLKNVR